MRCGGEQVGGVAIEASKLEEMVTSHGGLERVNEGRLWTTVARAMGIDAKKFASAGAFLLPKQHPPRLESHTCADSDGDNDGDYDGDFHCDDDDVVIVGDDDDDDGEADGRARSSMPLPTPVLEHPSSCRWIF